MKKFLLVSNLILLAATGVLYYLHFSYVSADQHKIEEAKAAAANTFKIAYFDLDTLENNYEYFKEVRTYLTNRKDQFNNQLNTLRTNFISKMNEFNKKGPNLSQTEQSEYQQQLTKMQDDYQAKEQTLGEQMNAETMQKMQDVKNKIQDFLKGYCRSKGYAYVFAASNSDYIYYKDTIRNITSDIVKLLNEQYYKEKKK